MAQGRGHSVPPKNPSPRMPPLRRFSKDGFTIKHTRAANRTACGCRAALGSFLGWVVPDELPAWASGRQRFNVLGAITPSRTNGSGLNHTCHGGDCLRAAPQNCRSRTGGTDALLDNAYRCQLVRDLAQQLGIELLFLPSYSQPESHRATLEFVKNRLSTRVTTPTAIFGH